MLSQLRASFKTKSSFLSEQENLQNRSAQLSIPNITESTVLSPIPDREENDTAQSDQLSPTSLSHNLSPTSFTHSSLSPTSPGFAISSEAQQMTTSPSSSTFPLKPAMPAEMFVIVRPPPGKQNHPLNLQIQLILPNLTHTSREPSLSTPAPQITTSPSQSQIFTATPISTAPEPIERSENSTQLNRAQSIRSVHSNRSSRSNRTCSSASEGRNRRVTPLYNLHWHNVLPTWICDAGTDAKVAKFAKKGLELIDLANIEPSEIGIGRYASCINLLLSGGPISPPAQVNTFLAPIGGTPRPGLNKQDRPGASVLFNKVKKLNVFSKKTGPKSEPEPDPKTVVKKFSGITMSEHCSHNDLPSTNAGLSTVGPTMEAGGRRAEGYTWIVRKWTKPEIVDWQNSSPKLNQLNPVFIEWRKAKKRARGLTKPKTDPAEQGGSAESAPPPPPPPAPVVVPPEPTPPPIVEAETVSPTLPPIAPDSALKLFTLPTATTQGVINFFGRFTKAVEPAAVAEPGAGDSTEQAPVNDMSSSEPTTSTTDDHGAVSTDSQPDKSVANSPADSGDESGDDQDNESGEDSDPEDSESPWHCEVVIQGGPTIDGRQQRVFVAKLTPHPHHPKLVAQLAVPWTLEPLILRPISSSPPSEEDEEGDQFVLQVDEIKDLVAATCMWLVVKERLGGVGKRRKGDRAWRI
ncbi:hypothetical protein MJO29_008973 [Puccinia striiformis f. sp. tritici]|uniref:hypothetical protein n=1 Tax=Puccinia striiformis f. sp. tritici TaxID=168172 RepID=UPI0020076846|nr:hypothetical protein Pst134EA_017778 [Puccinia striiformis f. sp. tritici]KAH9461473.1 hypothetical protein Pst134EA_017778 [Puccinia striiformis f. sp. tritici]KAI7950299.1 hypothetical protein MJO29_008973 [Puccinia striiformis f. sp. tritici]